MNHISNTSILVVASALLAGCSVDQYGLSNVTYYENDSGQAVRVRSSGLHLSTEAEDFGLYLGEYDATFLYPKNFAENPKALLEINFRADEQRYLSNAGDAEEFAIPESAPLGIVEAHTGVVLQINPNRVGLNLGMRSAHRILYENNGNGFYYINWKTEPEE